MAFKLNPITGQLDLVGSSGGGGGGGDVFGPASSVDNAIARYDGVTGKLLQDSLATIDDLGNMLLGSGTALLPSYGFTAEPGSDTGMYWVGAGQIGWSSQGVHAMQLDPGGDLTIIGNFTAANYPPTGSFNSFAGFDGTGVLFSVPGFQINTTSAGMDINLTEQPNNGGGGQVNSTNIAFDPLANSPNENWLVYNIQAQFDVNSSGFTQGTNGNAATLLNLGYNHQGTGSVGQLGYLNLTASLGNGTDPITIKGMNLCSTGIQFAANTTIDGSINGYGVNVGVDPAAFGTSSFSGQCFYDNANIQIPVSSWISGNFSPQILSINNNSNLTGLNINPTVPTFTGNAGFNGVAVSGTFTTFGATGGFNGVTVSPQVTTMGATGYWNGVSVYGTITTSHGNVGGIQVSTQINGGDANYNGISVTPNGTATLPSLQGIYVDLSQLDCTAQKQGLTVNDGRTGLSSQYHTDILPPSPGFVDLNSIGSEYRIKPTFPVTGTLVFGMNGGQTAIFEDDMGPDAFGGFLGYCANAFTVQGAVAVGKTVDTVTGVAVGVSIPDVTGFSITDGGTVTKSRMINILGFLNQGGSIVVDSLYGCNIAANFGAYATESWGFYNESDTENYFEKSLAFGTTSKKVTNDDIAIEIGSDKAIRFAVMSTTTRDSLTAVEGMTIFNTTTNLLEFYDGAAWQSGGSGSGGNLDGGTSTSIYGGVTAIDGGVA